MSTTTTLNTLKINYLTQSQYDRAVSGGTINENELYFTPDAGAAVIDNYYFTLNYPSTGNAYTASLDLTDASSFNSLEQDVYNAPETTKIYIRYNGGGAHTYELHDITAQPLESGGEFSSNGIIEGTIIKGYTNSVVAARIQIIATASSGNAYTLSFTEDVAPLPYATMTDVAAYINNLNRNGVSY